MNIYSRAEKRIKHICNRLVHAYRDDRPLDLCKERLVEIMQKLASYEPIALPFFDDVENQDE